MKTLIIYYSQHGSTEVVARTLAKELKTDILEVTDLKNRSGFKNKLTSCIDSIKETKTEIAPSEVDLTEYNSMNPPQKDKSKEMTGRGGQATVDRMAEKVKARGARVIETFTLNTKDKDIETLINDTEVIIDILDLKMYSG